MKLNVNWHNLYKEFIKNTNSHFTPSEMKAEEWRQYSAYRTVTFKSNTGWHVVWTFGVGAHGSVPILQLQFSILKIWTAPHITNVGEAVKWEDQCSRHIECSFVPRICQYSDHITNIILQFVGCHKRLSISSCNLSAVTNIPCCNWSAVTTYHVALCQHSQHTMMHFVNSHKIPCCNLSAVITYVANLSAVTTYKVANCQ